MALIILKENEENLLSMSFEVMLTQIVNMPFKFLIREFKSIEEEKEGISVLDKQMNSIKIPKMLLERLKREFDENFKISARNSISPDTKRDSNGNRNSNLN